MVQEIIIEIFSEYLANIGFVITFALIIESAMMHGIIFKFRTRIKVYFITLYLEKVRQLNPTKKEIFSLFFIDEIVAAVEVLEDLERQSQLFIAKAINDYKAEQSIINVLKLFSFKNRMLNKVSKYFTMDREESQLAWIKLFLDSSKLFKCLICPLLDIVEYLIEKSTSKLVRTCKIFLIFFRSL